MMPFSDAHYNGILSVMSAFTDVIESTNRKTSIPARRITMDRIKAIKEAFPDINWDRFEDIDRALNFELWYGIGNEYWGHADDLEHYEWQGFAKAVKDLEEILSPLPYTAWFDTDCDGLLLTDPEDDESNWTYQCEHCLEWIVYSHEDKKFNVLCEDDENDCDHYPNSRGICDWIGGDIEEVELRKVLCFKETYRQVF